MTFETTGSVREAELDRWLQVNQNSTKNLSYIYLFSIESKEDTPSDLENELCKRNTIRL